MGAGYYPLGGVLARQLRERGMWDYEPDQRKKQPASAIILHQPIALALGRFPPALWHQSLPGTKGLLICLSSTVFALAAHPQVIARNAAIQLKKALAAVSGLLDHIGGIGQQSIIGVAPKINATLGKLPARVIAIARHLDMTGNMLFRPAQAIGKHFAGIGQYLYL